MVTPQPINVLVEWDLIGCTKTINLDRKTNTILQVKYLLPHWKHDTRQGRQTQNTSAIQNYMKEFREQELRCTGKSASQEHRRHGRMKHKHTHTHIRSTRVEGTQCVPRTLRAIHEPLKTQILPRIRRYEQKMPLCPIHSKASLV